MRRRVKSQVRKEEKRREIFGENLVLNFIKWKSSKDA